ncbi:flagellar motor rotation protein MotA [Vibrio variabilis]|uniref:Flagellar motor rotation protein MotA n=1 Tax=Vibrio variabilis TaxID=990271 RepID=A0ABQ0JDT3_9VIBR|nr:flagellar motor rotation protein MotA [Vibrio variabilis]
MDLATLIGLIGGVASIIIAMVLGGSIMTYFDTTSVFIVIGGSDLCRLDEVHLGAVFWGNQIASKAFMFKTDEPEDLIAKIVEMADAARKGGFLALEEMDIQNSFMQKGIDLLVDGHDAEVVRNAMQKDIALTDERHEKGAAVFRSYGDVAPAMG